MEKRINLMLSGQQAFKSLSGLGSYLAKSSIEAALLDLIYFRVSQINGCAYCLDMHSKDLRANGEAEQRLYLLNAWREAPLYSEREKAALDWAESVTKINNGDVPDTVYQRAVKEFTEQELIDLTIGVIAINSYNRLNIAFLTEAGSYTPGQWKTHAN